MTVISLNKSKQQKQNQDQDQATIFEIVTNQNPNETSSKLSCFAKEH